ncbi:MAG: phage/plasmid primase, P4 family, partial [Syntrophaceae bacterium]|nr:phage/plasmid primase, P4 family [Syntrophaceae bacterium]
ENYPMKPTLVIHSGGGFHCYWVLREPVSVKDTDIAFLENISRKLCAQLGGDNGTQDISRVLRVPGTFNYKVPENPRPVTVISRSRKKYAYDDFIRSISPEVPVMKSLTGEKKNPMITRPVISNEASRPLSDVERLPVSEKIKSLIQTGNGGRYASRSEADMAVITALVNKGVTTEKIREIFLNFAIGEKYREHTSKEAYLNHTIEEAKKKSDLTEEEMTDPLFITNALTKMKGKYQLHIVRFQEYMVRKYRIVILDQEQTMFRYTGKCYEQMSERALNNLCQKELKAHRNLFAKSSLSEFIHYAVGKALLDSDKLKSEQLNYLTMQNGIYEIEQEQLLSHTSQIFTTNLLPFDYDPRASCPRFLQFLDEIFEGELEKIHFVQEAVGYIFHKSIPTPAVFFLIGNGSNGKSVFINTISSLVGKENTSNISFNLLSDETYILELYQKMINISGETPHAKMINTDVIKAVTAGDWVTGRELYKQPMKFRPYAKSFLAMNNPPTIKDTSHGMLRRIWIITFPRKFEDHEMDRQLEEKLAAELSGIFNWALDGYRRLRGNDFALNECDSMKMEKNIYRISIDSAREFIGENLDHSIDQNNRIKLSTLYDQYRNWSMSQGSKDLKNKNEFRRTLEDMRYHVGNSSKDNNQVHVFDVVLKKK